MSKQLNQSNNFLRWLGLAGEYTPISGETRPLWHGVPKSKYMAISIPLFMGGAGLLLILRWAGFSWGLAVFVALETFALVMLAVERSTIKVNDQTKKEDDNEVL